MNYTERFALPDWEKDDRLQMEDFKRIVDCLEENLCKIHIAYYTGDGTDPRTIPLPFTPKAIFVIPQAGITHYDGAYGGLVFTGNDTSAISIVENGITVRYYSNYSNGTKLFTNQPNVKYYYIAIA